MSFMMRLRHLFNNLALAEMLVKNWEYDESSLDLFQHFRISANAIYPFKRNGEICLLRCCPTSEKTRESIVAELEFIGYLHSRHYPALEPLPSKTGDEVVQKSTPWGDYYASVFKRVKGKQISQLNFDDEIITAYGAALGRLHSLSGEYTDPKTRRWTHEDVFHWVEETLRDLPVGRLPLDELRLLRDYFSGLPISPATYGLIHYDFETDNVFYDDATKSCSVIDFDDAMYHWYTMDIVQALDSLKDEVAADEFAHKKAVFIEGYRSEYAIEDDQLAAMPAFRRFANLYGYTRVVRAMQECWENEPEWLVELRAKLTESLAADSECFGKPIEGTS